MAIKFTTTDKSTGFIKCLVYGKSGIGKTKLSATAPNPVIISSEKKLLSLKGFNIPVILIENHEDLIDAYTFITTNKKAAGFQTIVMDSVSDIAEAVLDYFKKNPKDGNTHPQAAYGSLADELLPILKAFRDIPDKHVYFIAKAKMVKDDYTGITSWMPAMPGQQLGPGLPYLFDFVFAMRMGENESGKKFRYLQTEEDIQWLAKGIESLSPVERPDLSHLFKKVLGELPEKVEEESEIEQAEVPEKEVVEKETDEEGTFDKSGFEEPE